MLFRTRKKFSVDRRQEAEFHHFGSRAEERDRTVRFGLLHRFPRLQDGYDCRGFPNLWNPTGDERQIEQVEKESFATASEMFEMEDG